MADWSLIAKYIKQEALTPEEKQRVETWISEDQANERAFADMQKAMRPSKPLPDFNKSLEEDWTKIISSAPQQSSDIKIRKMQPLTMTKIAASILLVCLAGWVVLLLVNKPEEFVTLDTVREIKLEDGSTVWLNKHSKLLLAADFGESSREVTLEGEAYFEVTHNSAKRFVVHTEFIKTVVLGTRFNIRNFDNKDVIVSVTDGKVAVGSTDHIILVVRDEVATYSVTTKLLTKDSIQDADINFLSWKTGVIRFSSTQLEKACETLSYHYGVNVRVSEDIKDYEITSVIDHLTFDQAIEVVALTLDLHVERKNNQVILSK